MATFEARPAGAEERAPETHLGRLSLWDYRNFQELHCEFPAPGVAIVGPNGSGKTNLLEAIYYLQIFRSFRGARDRELVRFGETVFRIEADAPVGGRSRRLVAAYQRTPRRKKVEVDGRETERLSDAIGALGAVVFRLDDVEIIRGGPSERRRFLDILLSLVTPGYVTALQRYRSILGQRNEALREGAERPLLEAWTEGLVEAGGEIMAARARWVWERAQGFAEYHAAISGGSRGRIAYEPSLGSVPLPDGRGDAGPPPDAAPDPGLTGTPVGEGGDAAGAGREDCRPWRERLRRALAETAERERRRGTTVVGPHRDDLSFRATVAGEEERDLRSYGSSGQQRTAVLALRLAETDTLQDRLGREPLYILDDVFAELDEERSGRLLRLLDEGRSGQVVVTAPKTADVGLRGGGLPCWRIRNGRLLG